MKEQALKKLTFINNLEDKQKKQEKAMKAIVEKDLGKQFYLINTSPNKPKSRSTVRNIE